MKTAGTLSQVSPTSEALARPPVEPPFRHGYGAGVIAALSAGLMYVAATGCEIVVIRLLQPTEIELAWISDAVLAVSFGFAIFLWLHLKWTRIALSRLERQHIVLETQLTLAAQIQRGLLPPVPAVAHGVRWAARLEQAGRIGGDLYDFVQCAGGSWLVLVGDVSGKGIPAALVLASIRTMFRMMAEETSEPAELVGRISQTLYEDHGGMPYLTCVVARIDIERREIAYANAGHPPGLVFDGSHRSAHRWLLESCGPPAGMFSMQKYETKSLPLPPGATSVLVTDGITEAFQELGLPGADQIASIVAQLPHPPTPDHICDALIERTAAAFSPDPATWQDDRTVVAFVVDG